MKDLESHLGCCWDLLEGDLTGCSVGQIGTSGTCGGAGQSQSPDALNSLPTASALLSRDLYGYLEVRWSLSGVQALSLEVWISLSLLECFLVSPIVHRQASVLQSGLQLGVGVGSMTVGGVPGS